MTEMEARNTGCLDTVVGSRPLVVVLVAGVGVDTVPKNYRNLKGRRLMASGKECSNIENRSTHACRPDDQLRKYNRHHSHLSTSKT